MTPLLKNEASYVLMERPLCGGGSVCSGELVGNHVHPMDECGMNLARMEMLRVIASENKDSVSFQRDQGLALPTLLM